MRSLREAETVLYAHRDFLICLRFLKYPKRIAKERYVLTKLFLWDDVEDIAMFIFVLLFFSLHK